MKYLLKSVLFGGWVFIPVFIFFAFTFCPFIEPRVELVNFYTLIRYLIICDRKIDGEGIVIFSDIVIGSDRISFLIQRTFIIITSEEIQIGKRGRGIICEMNFTTSFFACCIESIRADTDKWIVKFFSLDIIDRVLSGQFQGNGYRSVFNSLLNVIKQHKCWFILVDFHSILVEGG